MNNNTSIRIEVNPSLKTKMEQVNEKRKSRGEPKYVYRDFLREGVNKIYDETFKENSAERELREVENELAEIELTKAKLLQRKTKLKDKIEGNDIIDFMNHVKPLLKKYRENHKDSTIKEFVQNTYEKIMKIYEQSSFKDSNLDSYMMETNEDKIDILVRLISENS